MSYSIPAVNIYQQLSNSGGVADTTPDLEACIVGPAYNIVAYVAGSATSLVSTAANSTSSGVATILAGSYELTFALAPVFTTGDVLLIPAATATSGILQATVVSASGLVLTLDTAAGVDAVDVTVTKQGTIVDSTISNTFALPSVIVGQEVDSDTVLVYANDARVETISTGFNGFANSNALTYSAAAGVGTSSVSSAVITGVTNISLFSVGDKVSLVGAGAAGALLTSKIVSISGSTVTLLNAAGTAVTDGVLTKLSVSNINPTTSTLMIEAGDAVQLQFTDVNSVDQTLDTTVVDITSATGNITNITVADVLPSTVAKATTAVGAISAGASGFVLTSATGFATGDTILIRGAGAGGTDHIATIGTLTTATITGLSPVTVTAVSSGAVVLKQAKVVYKARKTYNNQLVPVTKPISGGANYDPTTASSDGEITVNASPEVVYGKLISGDIHIEYNALRTDLSATVMAIENGTVGDTLSSIFGTVSELNPLALGCQIALANTTTRVRAIAISSNDLAGYQDALELAESERVYGLVPLTQDTSICQLFGTHAVQMSTPENALWRAAYVNTAIPTTAAVGDYTASLVNANSGNNTITLVAGVYRLNSSNATFITDGVVAGDTLNITAGSGSPSPVGTMQVLSVISNTQLTVQASGTATAVSYYMTRVLSKTQRAAAVASLSTTFGSNRVVHVQPDSVAVNVSGRLVTQPGYYLACALAGLVAGMPSQQGLTNIAVSGISDLNNSNFTFTRAQLNTMAAAGTLLFIQDTKGGLPYIRHELTTDMSVYAYREIQAVKNWDFLSYTYYDSLKAFIGKWNITPDTLNTIRQAIVSESELLKSRKLPRIGAPLVDYRILSLAQDTVNVDRIRVNLQTTQPAVLNYADIYLIL